MINYMLEHKYVATIIEIISIIIVTYIINKLANRLFKKSKLYNNIKFKFTSKIISGIIWIIGMTIAFSVIPTLENVIQTVLAGSGVIAVILTLGAQESFSNIISGLIISASKPFDIGDRLILRDGSTEIIGNVENITLRHTIIRTFKNTEYIITNSKLDSMIIENTTKSIESNGIVDFVDVQIAYESDINKAIKILEDIIGNHPLYLDIRSEDEIAKNKEKVTVRIRGFGDSGINIRTNVRTRSIDDSFKACSDCRKLIKEEFDKNHIEIPYNKVVIINQK